MLALTVLREKNPIIHLFFHSILQTNSILVYLILSYISEIASLRMLDQGKFPHRPNIGPICLANVRTMPHMSFSDIDPKGETPYFTYDQRWPNVGS